MGITDILATMLGMLVMFVLGEFKGFNKGFKDCENKLIKRK